MSLPRKSGARGIDQILASALKRVPKGDPFTSASLDVRIGRTPLGRALGRLVRKGLLERLAPGVFMRPLRSPYVEGNVPPELSKIVRAIAQRTGSKIQISGADAVSRLGLSTQVPMQAVYLTTGRTRTVKVRGRVVRYVHASPRKLVLAGRPAGIGLAALWYLGKAEVTIAAVQQIARRLGPKEFRALIAARPHMPRWMIGVLDQYAGRPESNDGHQM